MFLHYLHSLGPTSQVLPATQKIVFINSVETHILKMFTEIVQYNQGSLEVTMLKV